MVILDNLMGSAISLFVNVGQFPLTKILFIYGIFLLSQVSSHWVYNYEFSKMCINANLMSSTVLDNKGTVSEEDIFLSCEESRDGF